MKKFRSHHVGVDQGDIQLFSDFENGGDMWTGTGPRQRRRAVVFSAPFRDPPAVTVSVSLWDVDTQNAMRAEITAEDVTCDGFDVVFRTWGDTRVARLRVAWQAVGELPDPDEWELY